MNATVDLPNHFEECFEYLRVPIEDTPDACLEGELHKALEFVAAGSVGAATLVHCHFGVSRSASIVIAFLMTQTGLEYKPALETLREARWSVSPNQGFVTQLHRFGVTLD